MVLIYAGALREMPFSMSGSRKNFEKFEKALDKQIATCYNAKVAAVEGNR